MSVDTDTTPAAGERPGGVRGFVSSLLGRSGGLGTPAPRRGGRVITNEGERGYSTRAAVYMRHAAYLLVLVLCSSITHHAMKASGPYSIDGGMAMFFLATLT